MEVIITANSPGEIAGWTAPVVHELKRIDPEVRVTVMILPCAFASGREAETARNVRGVDRVLTVSETLNLILWGKNPGFQEKAVLLHLGGDLFYPVLIKLRIRCSLWAYEWAQTKWDGHFAGYFARDENNRQILLKRKIKDDKIHTVGDLLVDSVCFRSGEAPAMEPFEGLTVTFMPGSRKKEVLGLLPVFTATARLIKERFPETRFIVPVSSFINRSVLTDEFPLSPKENLPGCQVEFDGRFFSAGGIKIEAVDNSLSAILASDFIITIPGTSTGEAGTLGKPHLCIVPLNRPEDIPWVGIVGMLDLLPLIGRPLKRRLMLEISKTIGLVAQPNLRAGRMITPEIMVYVTPEVIFNAAQPYLADESKRNAVRDDLLSTYGPLCGAAEKIAQELLDS